MIPFLGLFVALGSFGTGVGLRTRTFFPLIWGGLFGGMPLLIATATFFAASAPVLFPLAIGMLAWGYANGKSDRWRSLRSGSSGEDSDEWTMGASSSSSSDSSGSSSSSFGGGSSGGGGASGRW